MGLWSEWIDISWGNSRSRGTHLILTRGWSTIGREIPSIRCMMSTWWRSSKFRFQVGFGKSLLCLFFQTIKKAFLFIYIVIQMSIKIWIRVSPTNLPCRGSRYIGFPIPDMPTAIDGYDGCCCCCCCWRGSGGCDDP